MKALALLSGGLDSIIATKLILDQDIEVVALNFILPFATEKEDYAGEVAKRFGIPLVRVESGVEYLDMVKNPEHGYGSGMNPCIDCRIYMLDRYPQNHCGIRICFIKIYDITYS